MGKWRYRFVSCLVVVFLAAAAIGPRAEVSADTQNEVILLVLGITEGPDPIPQVIWSPVRDVDEELFLNPDGGNRDDGRPDAAFHPDTGWPHVVWAYDEGTHHDIAISAWIGEVWSDIKKRSAPGTDDVAPRVSVSDAGTVYVAWGTVELSHVWMSTFVPETSTWGDAERVTGLLGTGRRPSILEWEGTVLVAYERDSTRLGQEVVVATRVGPGVYTEEIVATTAGNSPLDVILHDEQGVLWIDWRHSDSEYAYSIYSANAWSPLVTLPWTGDSWTRVEEVREAIRQIVLSQ